MLWGHSKVFSLTPTGFMYAPYLSKLAEATGNAGWTLVQAQLSSSYLVSFESCAGMGMLGNAHTIMMMMSNRALGCLVVHCVVML